MKTILKIIFILPLIILSQENEVIIDGQFNDWENIYSINDMPNENYEGVNFTSISVTNDNNYLYIRFQTENEIDLLDMEFNGEEMYNIEIFIDTDNDAKTGFIPAYNENIGCELGIMFNGRYVWYNEPNPDVQISLYDVGIFPAPTVTSNQFEIAIDLKSEYDGSLLFPNPEIKIQLRDLISGDNIPNINSEIIYTINSNPTEFNSINLDKENESLIRLTAYNVLSNGFNDTERVDKLKNTLFALKSDIFAFSECSNTSTQTVKNILDEILPINTDEGWFVIKKDNDDLILASKFPIINDWPNESMGIKKMHPCLIDLPDEIYLRDLLVINAHMSCCDNDTARQEQADDFVNFILDAKSEGGVIDLDENTPFVLCGDLNLVGLSQQLNALISGEIINTSIYGTGGGMNWSNNDLAYASCLHTQLPTSYTWRDLNYSVGSYPYGKLDYIIYSSDVINVHKSFSLDAEFMPLKELNNNNLSLSDSRGSDHLAITADFHIPILLNENKNENIFKKVLKKINLLGQNVRNRHDLSINLYNDGSVQKTYKIQ